MCTGHTLHVKKLRFSNWALEQFQFSLSYYHFQLITILFVAMKGWRLEVGCKTNICSLVPLVSAVHLFLCSSSGGSLYSYQWGNLPSCSLYLPHILALSLLSFYLFLSLTLCLFSISTVSLCFPGFLSYPTFHLYLLSSYRLPFPPLISHARLPSNLLYWCQFLPSRLLLLLPLHLLSQFLPISHLHSRWDCLLQSLTCLPLIISSLPLWPSPPAPPSLPLWALFCFNQKLKCCIFTLTIFAI